jgi:hypothetical protein
MVELEGCVNKIERFLSEEAITITAKRPSKVLHMLLTEYPDMKAPFTYVRMCMELAGIIENGVGKFTMPVGLDAKCSGTQIYGILTGSRHLMKATGFCSIHEKAADPYTLVAKIMGGTMNRNDCKRPYMIVQYGGGKRALLNDQELMSVMNPGLVPSFIMAVEEVLGDKVMAVRELVAARVLAKCHDEGVTHFGYYHVDGSLVKKPEYGSLDITKEYSCIRYKQDNGTISFGSYVKQTGITGISNRQQDAEEFARNFMVHFIQGIDALIARTVANKAEAAGIKGYCSIHDCFLSSADDVLKLKGIICEAYIDIFVKNDPLADLGRQLGIDFAEHGIESNITVEDIMQEDNYFFCQ